MDNQDYFDKDNILIAIGILIMIVAFLVCK